MLLETLSQFKPRYQAEARARRANYSSQGESPRDPSWTRAKLAAYTAVASLILNLDETITKE